MKRVSFIFTCACLLLLVFLSGCHTVKKTAVASKSYKQPKFIKGMYLNGHNKSSTTSDAIDPKKYVATPGVQEELPAAKPDKMHAPVEYIEKKPAVAEKVVIPNAGGPKPKKSESEDPEPFNLVSDNMVDTKYADMIGIDKKDIINHQLYKFVDKWYGTNYRLGGQTEEGIDCSGFAQKLYGDVYSIELTRTAMDQYKNCKREKRKDKAVEGDLVFFKQHSKRITHVGVYLANDFFVHSSTSQGVMISSLKEEYWQKHYVGIGKMGKED